MTKKTEWRRLRVVVELPVQGEYSEKDLVYHVSRLVGGANLRTRPGEQRARHGTVRVLSWSMTQGRTVHGELEARVALLEQQVRKLTEDLAHEQRY
jgi:hypothetical protein